MKKFILCALVMALAVQNTTALASGTPVSRSYLYAGSTEIYTHNVDRTGGNLTQVCPDYYETGPNGTLKLTRPVDDAFIQAMHQRGVEVLPFFSNHWNRELGRQALANRDALSRELANQVSAHNLDGIDIDLENLTSDDRDSFTAFISLLRQRLPAGKKVSVCVAATPWESTMATGWQGSYDYAALGQIADQVFMMTYDESYQGSQPGPVASMKFISDSINVAKKYIPAQKLLLGVPFYGRYWKQEIAGKAFTVADIERITETYPTVKWYNADRDCARAQVSVRAEDLAAGLWGNKVLTEGVYDIWYENPESYAKKLGLVRGLGVRGAASWALGQEPEHIWSSYRAWLNGLPFPDIDGHWAQSYITELYNRGLVTGYNGMYSPGNRVTRAELTVLLCRMLGILPLNTPSGFTDAAGHWADGYLAAMRKHNIIGGVTGTVFEPDRTVTRQEAAVLFEKVLHEPENMDYSEVRYPDVSVEANPWSNNAIMLLSVYKIIEGDQNGNFRPTEPCTRADAAKFAVKISELSLKLPDTPEPVIEPR